MFGHETPLAFVCQRTRANDRSQARLSLGAHPRMSVPKSLGQTTAPCNVPQHDGVESQAVPRHSRTGGPTTCSCAVCRALATFVFALNLCLMISASPLRQGCLRPFQAPIAGNDRPYTRIGTAPGVARPSVQPQRSGRLVSVAAAPARGHALDRRRSRSVAIARRQHAPSRPGEHRERRRAERLQGQKPEGCSCCTCSHTTHNTHARIRVHARPQRYLQRRRALLPLRGPCEVPYCYRMVVAPRTLPGTSPTATARSAGRG